MDAYEVKKETENSYNLGKIRQAIKSSKYFYNNFNKFKIHNIECNLPIDQNLKLAIDEYNDLEKIETWLLDKKDKIENLFPIKFSM